MAVKKKTTAKKKQAKKVKEMVQTHAMVEQESYQPTSLNQVWGDDGSGKYKTLNLEDFTKSFSIAAPQSPGKPPRESKLQ